MWRSKGLVGVSFSFHYVSICNKTQVSGIKLSSKYITNQSDILPAQASLILRLP